MRINHNIAALNTYRQLSNNSAAGSKSLEKLSSGLRINRAGDDAAGLAISEKMRAQIRGLNQAQRNAQDGISMIQTTEGALNEAHSILQRMRELSAQAANDTNVDVDREEIQKEINQLTSEINRIGNTTEFNTQSLLKGKNVAVVETAAAVDTIVAGEAGVVTGEMTGLTTNANSVVGVSSYSSVQASTSEATGKVSETAETTKSIKGEKATVTVPNGITFEASALGTALNGKSITIEQGTTAGAASTVTKDGSGNYTFTIGQTADGNSLAGNRGELYNELTSSLTTAGFSELTVKVPANTEEVVSALASTGTLLGGVAEQAGVYEIDITQAFKEAGDTITIGGQTFKGVIGAADPAKGEFVIAADANTAPTATAQATSLLAALQANAELSDRFTITNPSAGKITLTENTNEATGVKLANATVAGAGSNDKLNVTNANGTNLGTITIAQTQDNASSGTIKIGDQVVKLTGDTASAELNGINIKFGADSNAAIATAWDAASKTLTVSADWDASTVAAPVDLDAIITSINGATGLGAGGANTTARIEVVGAGSTLTGTFDAAAYANAGTFSLTGGMDVTGATNNDDLTIQLDQATGGLTIYLADTTASKNTAEKIQAAVQAFGVDGGTDYSKYTFTAEGDWDTNTLGNSVNKATGTFVGGTEEVKGNYSFELTKAFAAGDTVVIKGQTFTAVESGAVASAGQFNVSGGSINSQAAGLIDAINLNAALKDTYTATANAGEITISEKAATGTDLQATELDVRATGTQGEFTVGQEELLENGAKFIVDGEEILVTSANAHVGYGNGTAVKVAETLADQSKALADAINNNANLKDKYVASVDADGALKLTQTALYASETGPEVSTKNSSIGDFQATFQIGANSGQSMTITVADMRANALGISGDGSVGTIAANNGAVASYAAVSAVNSGSDNKNVEFALDVTTSEKASAALSVINDAIEKVSAQRSQLGAFQNRLDHTINNLGTSAENLVASESRIRDVDMAAEMMEFTKNNILSQAAQAMLAQSNQQPQGVLQLLR